MPMPDLYSAPSNWLVYSFSSNSDEILILAPSCLNPDFRYKIFKYQRQIRIQHLQMNFCASFQVNLTRFWFWDYFCPNVDFNGL